ncbi:replication protein A 70 kDa DNA-binding subunit B [Trifolium repens]|nr:replication protein A 70 kDa DNA-binding subunit B [Trifolium repens]
MDETEQKEATIGKKLSKDKETIQKQDDITALNKSDDNMLENIPVERKCDMVNIITNKKQTWKVVVILDDLWTVYKGESEDHIEMLLRDIKGDTIQAIVMRDDIEKWKPKLMEGKCYYMRNFKSVGKCVTASNNKKGSASFILQDLRENVLDVTLWDALSVEFISSYNKRTAVGPIVVIIKHVRVKEATGTYPLQFTNVWNGTKIMFDHNHPEIKAFVASLPKNVINMSQNTVISSSSTQYYTQSSAGSQYDSDENFMKHASIVSLADMKKLKKETFCVTVVTLDQIIPTNQGWYFLACKDCNCKTEGFEPPYVCKRGHKTVDPLIKYKLDVEVTDGQDTAKFVFWDSSLDQIVGLTAAALVEKQKKDGLVGPHEYPDMLEDLMNRTFAFRVKWQPGWGGQASVLNVKDSKELVAKIQEHLPVAESSCKKVDVIETIDEDVATLDDSPQLQGFTKDDIQNFDCLDDSILSTPNTSKTAENDLGSTSHKTPNKRNAPKPLPTDLSKIGSPLSSTRGRKLIKKEKI